jgi:prepilin-type processing-associated H-X9-DG protein/prepilin-type N-terminal cleavage/methylation domain-containing protein
VPGGKVGFTLLELLAVVAVIGILASLLLPALSKATASARQAECRGNLRDVGLAIRMYLDEREVYPTTRGGFVLGIGGEMGLLKLDDWKSTLIPYIGVPTVTVGDLEAPPEEREMRIKSATLRKLRCPQRVRNSEGVNGEGQYAYNAWGTGNPRRFLGLGLNGTRAIDGELRALREAEIKHPSLMIVAGDVSPGPTFVRRWDEWEAKLEESSSPKVTFRSSSSFDTCSADPQDWPGTSHNGKANMLFADGHVESARQANWVAATESARRRWNRDNEAHPETWQRP